MSVTAYITTSLPPRLHPSAPVEPSTRCQIDYLNEGGANIVFRLTPSGSSTLPAHLSGQLLRLRKNLSHIPPSTSQLASFTTHIAPLFSSEHLLTPRLVELAYGMSSVLNASLRSLNRPSHRRQDFLPEDETSGLLILDMSPREGEVLVQLKPKWLAQSPSAPKTARRCRTCALRAQRAAAHQTTATDAQQSCPLDLVSWNVEDRTRAAKRVTSDQQIQDFLIYPGTKLLVAIRSNQSTYDNLGTLQATSVRAIEKLCKAMTLRDCTLFLKRSGDVVEARLGDLDLKAPEKLGRWKEVERSLIEGGWYENCEDAGVWVKEEICALSRA